MNTRKHVVRRLLKEGFRTHARCPWHARYENKSTAGWALDLTARDERRADQSQNVGCKDNEVCVIEFYLYERGTLKSSTADPAAIIQQIRSQKARS